MTDFFDLVARQRAHRAFTDEPVDDATIDRLLRAATYAPSAENRQPWEFVVVRDAARRAAIGDLMADAWAAARAYSESRLDPHVFADVDRGIAGRGIAGAPVLIVVGVDSTSAHPDTIGSSAFPAVQNLLLGATALGLGSALTTIATVQSDALRSLLGLPGAFAPVAVVPLGHPPKPLGPPRREPPVVRYR